MIAPIKALASICNIHQVFLHVLEIHPLWALKLRVKLSFIFSHWRFFLFLLVNWSYILAVPRGMVGGIFLGHYLSSFHGKIISTREIDVDIELNVFWRVNVHS